MIETTILRKNMKCHVRRSLSIHAGGDRNKLGLALCNVAARWQCTNRPPLGRDSPESLSFRREEDGKLKKVEVVLGGVADGFKLVDIYNHGSPLGVEGWNDVLSEFVEDVAQPVLQKSHRFTAELGPDERGPEDWFSKNALEPLFQSLGSKDPFQLHEGTVESASWLKFVIALHIERSNFKDEEMLSYLMEAEGWPNADAQELIASSSAVLEGLFLYDKYLAAPLGLPKE
jgi:hypothetical protein